MSTLTKQIDVIFEKLLILIAVISTLTVAGLMIFIVFSRYVMGWSIIGLHEVILMSAMWLYMSGSMIASRRNEHLTVDLLYQKIKSPFWQVIHFRLVSLITIITCIFFMTWAYKLLGWAIKRPQSTPGLNLPLIIPQAAIIVASVFCFIYGVRDFLRGSPHNNNHKEL
nr:TRAP transporter small permease [uncultured Amphritea sp.]